MPCRGLVARRIGITGDTGHDEAIHGARVDRHAATRRLRRLADSSVVRLPRMHPHMLRHTFVTTMLDAGVDLRDVQIAARHADPRTTMRYDRARTNLDCHPNLLGLDLDRDDWGVFRVDRIAVVTALVS